MTVPQQDNIYLSGPLLPLFAKTAFPIVLVMTVNGLFTIVDAYFLGVYVGADAVIAVTLMFPLYMMLVALTTLVSNGFSSIYARVLGASDTVQARAVFVSAVQLSLLVSIMMIALFVLFGVDTSMMVANGSVELAALGRAYMGILIWCAPLGFVLAINIDALRAEGLLAALAGISLFSAVLNIGFDWLFVARMGWGVQGSAYGTVLSQFCAMAVLLLYRRPKPAGMLQGLWSPTVRYWRDLLALGAPSSLGYLGMSLSAAVTLYSLQLWADDRFEPISGAFGIMTRLMTFTFLPLLGVSLAFQTIVGNNFGAGKLVRAREAVRIAIIVAFVYCAVVQAAFVASAPYAGAVFVDDPMIQSELARILPLGTLMLFVFGPMMMISTYFQAVGDAGRAAVLGLSRAYAFGIPLTLCLPYIIGEPGIWIAGAVAECLVLALTLYVVMRRPHRAAVV